MNKPRVLHFIWSANFGGIEKMAIELAAEQNRSAGTDAALLVGCNKGRFLDLIARYKIPVFFGELKSGYDFSLMKLYRMIQAMRKFDIIHFHTFNIVALAAAILSTKKIIYTIHGNFNYGKTVSTGDKINNLLRKYFLNHHVDFITFNSNWCRGEAINKFNIRKTPCKVIYNGLPPAGNSAKDANAHFMLKPPGKFIVGTISRFNKSKRIERLIEGFALFSKDKPDAMLLLVGDGVEMKQLENIVDRFHISSITQFTGYQPDTRQYHEIMDVCVFPFENEAFGLVVLESFQLGKPAIIFQDSGGMKEIQGEYFRQDIVNTPQELAVRLNSYYQHKNLKEFSEPETRKHIASQFTISRMQHEFMECYASILNSPG